MPNRFERDTAVRRLADDVYEARIDRGWWIVNGPNGGYVAALFVRALADAVGDAARAPRTLTVSYLRPPAEGPARIETRVERAGRSLTTASARLLQEDRLLGVALGTFARGRATFECLDADPPAYRPPGDCPRLKDELAFSVQMHDRYDSRLAAGSYLDQGPRAECGGWIRLAEPSIGDAALVAAFTDAFPPALYAREGSRGAIGPLPTIDLGIHFRATLPLPGATPEDFYAVRFSSRACKEGFVEEDGEVWSSGGVLLAQSRQLALLAATGSASGNRS